MATTWGQTSSRLWSRESRVGNLLLGLVQLAEGGRDRCLGHRRVQDDGRCLGVERRRQEPIEEGLALVAGQLISGGEGRVDREDDAKDEVQEELPEQRDEQPDPETDEGRGGRALEQDRQEHPEREPHRDVQDRDRYPDDEAQHLGPGRDDAQPQEAEAGDHHHHRHEDDRDRDQGGAELAVDDRVAMDGLGHQAGERALGPLAVHRVEREGDPQQRRGEADEGGDREVEAEEREVLADR